ncbi:sugar transferase [Komarekiella sp. 'clone 1']|uniref:Sugar transferase n=1 Tax=Komarekiella delphini-convector SJRDD-AB1 TaxID=2593771 RepID=A0AA40VUC2_9NOST|nr:sugar transferase [Komarekiella delphini-convector]MBD6619997.1 sugar transferase [Komarekiella delphini-convector SJRDD-AB1]
MTSRYLPLIDFKPDLRSAKGTRIQRGLALRVLRIITLILLDAMSLTLAWKLAIFYGTPLDSPWTERSSFQLLTLAVAIGMMAAQGLYEAGIHRRNYARLIKAVSLSEFFLLLIAFLYEPSRYVSRSSFILFWLFSVAFICVARLSFDVATNLVRTKGAIRYPVFLITDAEDQQSSIRLIEKENCYNLMGVAEASSLDRYKRESTLEFLRNQGIVEAFVSWNAIKNRLYISWHFMSAGITLRILPTEREVLPPKTVLWMIGEVPCLTIPAPIIAGSDFWVKRGFDLCCATILLLLLAPIYLLISLLIKLDSPGPILFKQKRIGLHCKEFKIWKFRTMVANAEKLQASLEAKNEIKDGVLFKLKDDPRVTRVGKFLRRYSLDELPQLFNVLIGEMSLVGPRPLPVRDVERFQTTHFIRQEVLPGITGLWQVSGRSDIENFEDGVKLDITYIENWSLWLDLKILLKTVSVVLQKTGAY